MSIAPFDPASLPDLPFPSRRSAVMSTGPMVATSQPLAAQEGLQMMLAGGNAFDAAVTAAAVLGVVEPTGAGIGGDCFALLYLAGPKEVLALNGSGRSPSGLTPAELHRRSLDSMPLRGALTVTVPGAVHAWSTLLERHGRMTLGQVLEPAIRIAESGYPVSEVVAAGWAANQELLAADAAAARHYLPAGHAPRPGELVRLPTLAGTLRRIAEGGREAFYRGAVGQSIADCVQAAGGVLTTSDLADHTSDWVEPISASYRDVEIWECPPNGQGLAALVALAVLDGIAMPSPWGSADHLHLAAEATKRGLVEARSWVSDPVYAQATTGELLSVPYIDKLRRLIDPNQACTIPRSLLNIGDDTVYVATIDREGNACSLLNSNYMGFGSGLVVDDRAIALQNRGAGFVLEKGHPNCLAPRKRPYHTIIPALATRPGDHSLYSVFGVMGGHMQPQGHVQVVLNMLAYPMDPQRALDAPRFQITLDDELALEPWFGDEARSELVRRGHRLLSRADTPREATFGGGQIIAVTEDGVRIGGSDPRKDGCAVASA